MICECELRNRAWDPNTLRCRTCGRRYHDTRLVCVCDGESGKYWNAGAELTCPIPHAELKGV